MAWHWTGPSHRSKSKELVVNTVPGPSVQLFLMLAFIVAGIEFMVHSMLGYVEAPGGVWRAIRAWHDMICGGCGTILFLSLITVWDVYDRLVTHTYAFVSNYAWCGLCVID